MGVDKLYIQLSYPMDEVGNHIVSTEQIYEAGVNPYTDVFSEPEFRARFNNLKHEFTAVDYLELYRSIGNNAEIILANDPCEILKYTKNIIAADIHTRNYTKHRLLSCGAESVCGLDEILNKSVDGSGYNEHYGILGSNKAGEDKVKLFPRSCEKFVSGVQKLMQDSTGVKVEVLVYGDGAFKDPVGKIWELADPVVSPAFTEGLAGTPNEIKIKYIADTDFADLSGQTLTDSIRERIRSKKTNLVGDASSLGTTPRRIHDLVGSLCDLVAGSGDRGTPVVLVQNYFKNYASD